MHRMVEISGQSMTPTFEEGEFVVADFSVDEFLDELERAPEIKIKLGIGDEESKEKFGFLVNDTLAALREKLGDDLGLVKDGWAPLWVTDFPMFAWNGEESRWDPLELVEQLLI